MTWILALGGILLAGATASCEDDGSAAGPVTGNSTATGMGGSGGAGGSTGPGPGGPIADAGADMDVIGGLTVPLDGSASMDASSYLWNQTTGAALDITGDDTERAMVVVPENAPGGSIYGFDLTVTDAGGATSTDQVVMFVHNASFETFVETTLMPTELGTSEGIAFNNLGLWVVSMTDGGFVSLFGLGGNFVARYDVGGQPVGANFAANGLLLVANAADQSVQTLETSNSTVGVLTDMRVGGGGLGAANYPLPDKDGNVYLSNRVDLEVLRYDASKMETSVFLGFQANDNPNSVAFGPESDQLYVGIRDTLLRVPINGDGSAGTPETYLDLSGSGCGEIDGIAWDEGGNVYLGCPNTSRLFIAPYSTSGPTAVARMFEDVGQDITSFVNTSFGNQLFGTTTIYYANLGGRAVGRVEVGLRGMTLPLAPPML